MPSDLVARHAWLFAAHWIEPSYGEYEDEDFSFENRNKLIHDQRLEALREIWAARGFDGIKDLVAGSGAAYIIGQLMRELLKGPKALSEFVKNCVKAATGGCGQNSQTALVAFFEASSTEIGCRF